MDNMRTIMDFEFDTSEVQNTHFHQNIGDCVCSGRQCGSTD